MPMFSALWAIANQQAGTPLGQAAPYLYTLPASAITDIVPYGSKNNVTGVVKDSSGTTSYSAVDLVTLPLEPLPPKNPTPFFSAIWNDPLLEGSAYVVSFGTDTGPNLLTTISLVTAKGWDSATSS